MDTPKTLREAVVYFSDAENCRHFMIEIRWPEGVVRCPTCNSDAVTYLEKAKLYFCKAKHARQKFSLKIGTIFEDSPIGLEKWLPAFWLLSNCKNGVSSYEAARALGVTQKSAWFMMHRIRFAMQEIDAPKLGEGGGPVEIDESFLGGKVKNVHKSERPKDRGMQRGAGKAVVLGMLERGGRVRAKAIKDRTKINVAPVIKSNVAEGSHIMTDEFSLYPTIAADTYIHDVINHSEAYVREHVHTNGIENFWSLLKRGINGTYVAVEPFHLDRCIAEQVFRFNNRATKDNPLNDADRFYLAMTQTVGKRLTLSELTGKAQERPF